MTLRPTLRALGLLACLPGLLASLPGCHERVAFREPELSAPRPIAIAGAPETAEGFLEALLPLQSQTVRVTYDVSGPGGIAGDLVIIARAGGFRKESWSLSMPTPSATPLALDGSTIRTPRWSWTDAVDGAPQLHAVSLGALADAFASLDRGRQDAIFAQIDAWKTDLERARGEHPGQREDVLGQTCLVTSVVGHSICVWEETGLPLRYGSEAFTVTARAIDRAPDLDAGAFAIPAGGVRAPDDARDFDVVASLERLEAGDLTEIQRLGLPMLRFGGSQ